MINVKTHDHKYINIFDIQIYGNIVIMLYNKAKLRLQLAYKRCSSFPYKKG